MRGENLTFWRHLSNANLIDGAYGSVGNAAINPATGFVTADISGDLTRSMPPGKLRVGVFVATGSAGMNYYMHLGYNAVESTFGSCSGTSQVLTPVEAHSLDSKIDDGLPNLGRMLGTGLWAAAGTSGRCKMGEPPSTIRLEPIIFLWRPAAM